MHSQGLGVRVGDGGLPWSTQRFDQLRVFFGAAHMIREASAFWSSPEFFFLNSLFPSEFIINDIITSLFLLWLSTFLTDGDLPFGFGRRLRGCPVQTAWALCPVLPSFPLGRAPGDISKSTNLSGWTEWSVQSWILETARHLTVNLELYHEMNWLYWSQVWNFLYVCCNFLLGIQYLIWSLLFCHNRTEDGIELCIIHYNWKTLTWDFKNVFTKIVFTHSFW